MGQGRTLARCPIRNRRKETTWLKRRELIVTAEVAWSLPTYVPVAARERKVQLNGEPTKKAVKVEVAKAATLPFRNRSRLIHRSLLQPEAVRGNVAKRGYHLMSGIIKSTGYGLFAAGVLLTGMYFFGAYLKGNTAFNEAMNPLMIRNYLALAPMAPGALLIWLADRIGAED